MLRGAAARAQAGRDDAGREAKCCPPHLGLAVRGQAHNPEGPLPQHGCQLIVTVYVTVTMAQQIVSLEWQALQKGKVQRGMCSQE